MTLLTPERPTPSILEAFIGRHQHLLELERGAEEEQTRLLNSKCSPKLLEQKGLALGGLGVGGVSIGLGGKTSSMPEKSVRCSGPWAFATFACSSVSLIELVRPLAYHISPTLPSHTFRNGDPVRIEAHASTTSKKGKENEEKNAVDGIVYRISSEKVVVALDGSDSDLPERLRLLKVANSVTFDRMDKTMNHLKRLVVPDGDSPHAKNFPLIHSLLGIQPPTWRKQQVKEWYTSLNDSQKEAIEFCLGANTVACVHGPPGTGKTHTLIELIYQLLSDPEKQPRILITTPSNLALDNLLLRLYALSSQPPLATLLPRSAILRIGHPTRVHRDLISATLDYQAKNGDEGELVRDIGKEIDGHLGDLGRKRGERGAVKGKERGKKWEEVRELRKEYRQREGKVVGSVVSRAQVVLATCHSAGSKQLNNVEFDVCILDEATQAVEAVCWVPILKAKKLILAGDPKQLPPTIMGKADRLPVAAPPNSSKDAKATRSDDSTDDELTDTSLRNGPGSKPPNPILKPPHTLETTLFDRLERMYGSGIKRVLTTQYRMHDNIASFPSSTLYNSALISDDTVARRTLLDLVEDGSEDAVDALSPPVVFFDTAGCEYYERTDEGESTSNENEAVIVEKWARKLVSFGINPADIAIVTPYQAQVALISSMLIMDFPEMTIGSVDGLQGQEREAIILSLVRSNNKGEIGFLAEYRRLNVAMTRAKRQLCVVGDSATVGKGTAYLKKWISWLQGEADVRWAGDEVL